MDLKEYIKSLIRQELDEMSTTSAIGVGAGPIMTPYAFAPKGQKKNAATKAAEKQGMKVTKGETTMPSDSKVKDYKSLWPSAKKKGVKIYEMKLNDIIDQELLSEVTYHKFKNEVKYRTKAEQLHKAIREVKRKLQEIDRIVEYTQRMKQELSEGDGIQYWNRTNKAVAAISEMVNHLNNKIKNLNQ